MMTNTIITKTTQTGKRVEIIAIGSGYEVRVDGVSGGSVSGWYRQPIKGQKIPAIVMDWGGKMISLTEGEAQIIDAHKAATAVAAPLTREDLVGAYKALCDDQAADYQRLHDRQDETAYAVKTSYEPRIKAAFAAIADWDRTH